MSFIACEECRSRCTDHCFAENARSIHIPSVAQIRQNFGAKDARISSDNDAYRRLRKDGIQPAQVTGSAKIEAKLDWAPPIDPHSNNRRVIDVKEVA